jgi:hypothetical protein
MRVVIPERHATIHLIQVGAKTTARISACPRWIVRDFETRGSGVPLLQTGTLDAPADIQWVIWSVAELRSSSI